MNKGFDKGDVIRYELISWLLHWYWHCDFSVPDDLLCLTPDCLQPTGPHPVHVWWTHAWNRPGCSSMMSHLVDWLMNKNHLICWFIKLKVDSMVSLLFVEHKILCILSLIFILWINCSLKIRKMAKHYICTGYTFANEFQYCNFYWIDDNWWPWILNKPLRNCDIHT